MMGSWRNTVVLVPFHATPEQVGPEATVPRSPVN